MERARQAAVKAAESSLIYFSEEHPETGHALACLCESTGHRGPVDDSICDAIHALAVRIKVRRLWESRDLITKTFYDFLWDYLKLDHKSIVSSAAYMYHTVWLILWLS